MAHVVAAAACAILVLVGGCRRDAASGAAPSASTGPAAPAASTAPRGGGPSDPRRIPRIDIHTHVDMACLPGMVGCNKPDAIDRALAMMKRWGIDGMVNLSGMHGGPPRHILELQLKSAAASGGHMVVFANADFRLVLREKDYGQRMAAQLEADHRLGAVGLKIPKGLGLGYPRPDGQDLLAIDDPGLDPLFEKAGELKMPIAIHIGDPKAFWKPVTPANERWDELGAHPEWAFVGKNPYGKPYPTWQQLYDAFERRVARHPRTTFIAVHFGNDPEDPGNVARMLDKYPNFYIDTAARVPEIGRHDATRMRAFFEKYQDRILYGSDTGIGAAQDQMMYGSNGPNPPTEADEVRFFTATWRYFETRDQKFDHPTPIQGRWKIDGIGLPEPVLRKIYFDNAARLLRWKPTLW